MPQSDEPSHQGRAVTVVATKENTRNAQVSSPCRQRCSARLTFARLAQYEDFLTHTLIDSAGTTMLKYSDAARNNYEDQQAISSILQHFACNADMKSAEQRLLALISFQVFVAALEPEQKHVFQCHLRRYLQAYHPQCPFTIARTNQYDPDKYEAKVVARSLILRGEEIKFLRGITLRLTEEQEADLDQRGRAFSIMWTSRKKQALCLAGLARCLNSDCRPNAEFFGITALEITAMAIRDIRPGDQITVDYGEHYFGDGRSGCLCESCENQSRDEGKTADLRYSLRKRKCGIGKLPPRKKARAR